MQVLVHTPVVGDVCRALQCRAAASLKSRVFALRAASQSWINKEHVIGRAKGYLPYIGMVTIIMNDYPIVKYILVGLMGLFVLTTKE